MADKLTEYRQGTGPLPEDYTLWPLYGAGFENLGRDGKPIEVPLPKYGPDELLVRHDACGLCFSDVKVIRAGENHPRIFRDMKKEPIVLGHEITMTVVGVGENLRDEYKVGDRFIVQADIYVDGVNLAYGYMIQGGISQYSVVDQRVLNGDGGNYLIRISQETGYAESALIEPWTTVITAYHLQYRSALKPGGTLWVIGTDADDDRPYTISDGFDEEAHPSRLLLTNVPDGFASWLKGRAEALDVEVAEQDDIDAVPCEGVDDIVILGTDAELVERVNPCLGFLGILAVVADEPFSRTLNIDVGRIHYNRWLYVCGSDPDISRVYDSVPIRAELKPGGRTLFVGSGGPMGRIHVQRALQIPNPPETIVCTDISDFRLEDLRTTFSDDAEEKAIEFICLNPSNKEAYAEAMARFREEGFDNVVVLAPVPAVISDSATWLAPGGVMNIFAGVVRGTIAQLDLNDVCSKDVRFIGHSGLTTEDMRLALRLTEAGEVSPDRLVAAVGSIEAAKAGWQAVQDAVFSGKVVIYMNIEELPLTPLQELKDRLPTVYAKMRNGREWNKEAEEEFLRLMLL
jgi:threonine dehydrogenase-like Zn-dependent dehydrogenase